MTTWIFGYSITQIVKVEVRLSWDRGSFIDIPKTIPNLDVNR